MKPIGFHPIADQELRESAAYYEIHVPGLSAELIAEVERICSLLSVSPESGAAYNSRHRRVLLRRFPFSLIDRVQRDAIMIVAVAHTKRRPGYWQGRV